MLQPGTLAITKIQPQLAQLEIQFKGPLVVGDQVESISDLLLLNENFAYEHKRVWVKESKAMFYLDNGDGTQPINWKRDSQKLSISKYEQINPYLKDECVYIGSKLYIALQNVPAQIFPYDAPDFWLPITAEVATYRYLFSNASSVRIYTEIRNPKFEIIIGTFKLNGDGSQFLDPITGLAVLENQERVDAPVILRDDILPDNGVAYDIEFYEEEILTAQTSGCINIK